MSISLIMSRLAVAGDIFNPSLITSLMILEDISSLGEREEQALIDNNLVPRITQTMSLVISYL
jgi:hypothetical protein